MADLVIRGIEMSKSDLEYVSLWVYGDGRVYVRNKKSATSSQRLQDLAVILPEGHGRLGDLDKLKKLIYEIKTNRGTYQKVINIVDLLNATTIVPAEGDNEDD